VLLKHRVIENTNTPGREGGREGRRAKREGFSLVDRTKAERKISQA